MEKVALLVGSWGNVGGIERHNAILAATLQEQGIPTQLIIPKTAKSAQLSGWFQQEGVQAEASAAFLTSDMPHGWKNVQSLRHALEEWRPDVVSLHYREKIPVSDIIAVRLAGVKQCIVSLHCVPYPTRLRRVATRLILPLIDVFVVHSRPVADALRNMGVPIEKIVYFPYGLPLPKHIPSQQEARTHLDIPQGAFVIGVHARLTPEKAIDNVIEAVSMMPGQDSLHLLIAGTGTDLERLEAFARMRQIRNIRWLGQLNGQELTNFYASLDVFALAPAWQEAFGLVFIEAAQCGVPSVSWNVGGIAEAVVHENTGLLAPAHDIAGLTEALTRIRSDERLRSILGNAARQRAKERFSHIRMTTDFTQVMSQLARQKHLTHKVGENYITSPEEVLNPTRE